jgi:hypothetical protein
VTRRAAVLALLFAACAPESAPSGSGGPEAWEPVEAAFEGCGGGCGGRLDHAEPGVAVQPGAEIGVTALCPVSGVAFVVDGERPRRELSDGRSLYFCCEGCAAYFDTHRAEVLHARGIDEPG